MKIAICIVLIAFCALADSANLGAVKCGPVCMIYCPFGNVLTSDGCPTCKCSWPEPTVKASSPDTKCLGVMCDMYCINGFATGIDGCPICACQTAANTLVAS